jgi:hypothetical protein
MQLLRILQVEGVLEAATGSASTSLHAIYLLQHQSQIFFPASLKHFKSWAQDKRADKGDS